MWFIVLLLACGGASLGGFLSALVGYLLYKLGARKAGHFLVASSPFYDSMEIYRDCPYSCGEKCRIWTCAAYPKNALVPCKIVNEDSKNDE